MLMSIIITAAGLLGVLVSIVFIFFKVKEPIEITKKDTIYIIIWLILMTLGGVNLYFVYNNDNNVKSGEENNNIQESDDQDQPSSTEEVYTIANDDTLSEKELLLIKQNYELIQQLKAEYTDEDTITIQVESVYFYLVERACYVFRNLKKDGTYYELDGADVLSSKVIFLDYYSDEIIYDFDLKQQGTIHYTFTENIDKFYCVVFLDDYEIYVSRPISVILGDEEYSSSIEFFLNKEDDKYTSLFQIRIHMLDIKSNYSDIPISDDYIVKMEYKDIASGNCSRKYYTEISESGILEYNNCSYFSLNENYVMNFYLYHKIDDDNSELVAQEKFNGDITNSNLVDIYFTLEDESDTSE